MFNTEFDMIVNSKIIPRKVIYDVIIDNWYHRGRDDLGEQIHIYTSNMSDTIDEIACAVSRFKHQLNWYKTTYRKYKDWGFMELGYKDKKMMFVFHPESHLYYDQRGNRGIGVIVDISVESMRKYLQTYNGLGRLIMHCIYPSENNFGTMWIY